VFHVGVVGDGVEQPYPNISHHPIAKAREDAIPVANGRRQIKPWTAGAADTQHGFNEQPIILAAAAGVGLPRQSGSIFAHWASSAGYS
jgi:hypothetical protein